MVGIPGPNWSEATEVLRDKGCLGGAVAGVAQRRPDDRDPVAGALTKTG